MPKLDTAMALSAVERKKIERMKEGHQARLDRDGRSDRFATAITNAARLRR